MKIEISEIDFIKSYLDKGYKVNGASNSLDMAMYLLKENNEIRLIKFRFTNLNLKRLYILG